MVLFWICAAAVIAYTQRATLGVVEKEMREDLGLTTGQSTKIMTTGFFITYALCQVPAGWLGQVFGSRKALALFTAVGSVAAALCAIASRVWVFVGLRATMGINQAGLFPCTTGTIKNWFPWSHWGMANGFLTASQQAGAGGGMIAAGFVAAWLGWRWTFVAFAIPGLLWAAWFLFWFRDRPDEHSSVNPAELALLRENGFAVQAGVSSDASESGDVSVPWLTLLLSPTMAWFCTQQFFRGAGYIFFSSWFTTYLRDAFPGVKLEAAALLTSMPLWANGIGCICGGAFSDWLLYRTGSRRIGRQGLAVVSQLACAALALVAQHVTNVYGFVAIMSFGSFCAAAGGPIAYAVSIDMGREHVRPVFSLMNMWGNLGSLSFPILVSFLVGDSPKPKDWEPVLPVFALIYVLAGLSWLGFNPDKPILAEPTTEADTT
jgi:ACS family glucarate transporter-like MFS transporter